MASIGTTGNQGVQPDTNNNCSPYSTEWPRKKEHGVEEYYSQRWIGGRVPKQLSDEEKRYCAHHCEVLLVC